MQLVTAFNFFSVKHRISTIINSSSDIRISTLNRILRKELVGKEADSLFCRKISQNLISVRVTLKTAVTVFLVDINKRGDKW